MRRMIILALIGFLLFSTFVCVLPRVCALPDKFALTILEFGDGHTDLGVGIHLFDANSVVVVNAYGNIGIFGEVPHYWLLDGVAKGSDPSISVTMDADHTLIATFNVNVHSLTTQVDGQGTISPPPATNWYIEGYNVVVSASPSTGWVLDHWLLDGVDVGSSSSYTVTMNTDHTLKAVFIQKTIYSLFVGVDGDKGIGGTILGETDPPMGTYSCVEGSVMTVQAIELVGGSGNGVFEYWLLDGVNVGSASSITVTMDSDHTLIAMFTIAGPLQVIPEVPLGTALAAISMVAAFVCFAGFKCLRPRFQSRMRC